ncbi:MAG: T9SS type A sorting domain-containing protein [Bacteroidetes bacterium]|nr:T9SS type A sorting domain-containing protein [Bacteroidota bacterium]
MKRILLLAVALMTGLTATFSQVLYEDDFESYNVGDYIAVANPEWWTTWSGAPGGAEDLLVSDEQASSGSLSLKVEGSNDAILKLGDKLVGKYKLSFKYYVPSGYGAYYNIQHFESPGIEWAYEVYFGSAGAGYLSAGSEQVANFTFANDTWVEIENVIDLDNDWTQLYIDGNLIYEWPFSWQFNSQTGTLQLGGMDVWAGAPTGDTPLYYLEDLSFESIPSALYEDDMESYNVGEYLAVQNPDWWTTWSNAPGGTEDALISDDVANSGSQSVKVEGVTDLVLKLGDKTSGKYQLKFYYYIPTGFGGYYNVQHFESPGIEWAYEVYFGSNGTGNLDAGVASAATFSFPIGDWFLVDQIIDVSNDLVTLYIDGNMIYEWPFSYQSTGTSGTLQLGGVDIYAGAPTGDTPMFYFDDVEFIQLEAGTGAPLINIDPTVITEGLNPGGTSSQNLNIANNGEADLDYSIMVTYPEMSKNAKSKTAGNSTQKVVLSMPVEAPAAKPGGSPEPTDDVILNYDGDNFSAVGLTDGGPMRVAANFTSDFVQDYIGMQLSSIDVYINDQPLETKAQVYNYGLANIPGPGEMLVEQEFTPVQISWNTINLDEPVMISGGDVWVGYWVDHDAGTFPAGTDAGPHHPQGDWISTGPGWSHLSDNAALDYNWNIRATLTGDPIVQWLSVSPMSGTVAVGENEDVMVDFDATNLEAGEYYAELVINNNDPDNDQMIVPVTLDVTVGIYETEKTAVMIYPNPATENIHVKSDATIQTIELLNLMGQQVNFFNVDNDSFRINSGNLDSGIYILKIRTDRGEITQKVTVQ